MKTSMKTYGPVDQASLHDAKILIIDDESANIDIVMTHLEEDRFSNLYSESNPSGILKICERIDSENGFDLIILDLMMPKINGFDVMKKLAKVGNKAPIMVVTALNQSSIKLKALEAGASDFIGKPFSGRELIVRTYNLLLSHLAQKRLLFHNEALDQIVREQRVELEKSRFEVIKKLSVAAEFRDNETGLHVIRMSKYAQLIALKSGFSEPEANLLLMTAPMHDVGKIGIPDNVLLKSGKLDENEWAIMRRHPKIGSDMLSSNDSELLKVASQIAMSHHEKWNGSGYPKRLQGDKIPIYSRIVAIADVFDALTTKRPYKDPWSIEKTISFMKAQKGQHFEPKLLSAFFDVFPDILEVRKKHQEPTQ